VKITEEVQLNWSKKIPSDSAVRDPLGIWNHLDIQTDFVPGITSVTDRIRYYTLLAWYWQNLGPDKILNQTEFERYFILACLAHHDGNFNHPSLNYVFNKTRFKNNWTKITRFDLKFQINGFGRSYYSRQLDILRCVWTDIYGDHFSPINAKLADSLKNLSRAAFREKNPTKQYLKTKFNGLCICDSENNYQEIEIISKLFFGFFSERDDEWDIDDEAYDSFLSGEVDLNFEGKDLDLEYVENINELSRRRRNTLFMFLKIISETQPEPKELVRYVWDATYFSENSRTKKTIEFGRLSNIRLYWEFLQLNVYYVFALESILDVIQKTVQKNPCVKKTEILETLKESEIYSALSRSLGEEFSGNSTILDIIDRLEKLNGEERTSLNSSINESSVFDNIERTDILEEKLAHILVMLCLLESRYWITSDRIRNYKVAARKSELTHPKLDITLVLTLKKNHGGQKILEYLKYLVIDVVDTHLSESAQRYGSGTRNWIFTEEEGNLTSARTELIRVYSRDNRWESIRNLLVDLKFIKISNNHFNLTSKGELWLKKIG
jgi:hypothetical protein